MSSRVRPYKGATCVCRRVFIATMQDGSGDEARITFELWYEQKPKRWLQVWRQIAGERRPLRLCRSYSGKRYEQAQRDLDKMIGDLADAKELAARAVRRCAERYAALARELRTAAECRRRFASWPPGPRLVEAVSAFGGVHNIGERDRWRSAHANALRLCAQLRRLLDDEPAGDRWKRLDGWQWRAMDADKRGGPPPLI